MLAAPTSHKLIVAERATDYPAHPGASGEEGAGGGMATTRIVPTPQRVPKKGAVDSFLPRYSSISLVWSSASRIQRVRVSPLVLASSASSPTVGSSSGPSTSSVGKPQIELEFVSPKPEADGSFQKQAAVADSGEKLLRNIMLDNKIELYAAYGKVMNCGGGGSCGTCIVEIVDGKDLLNERTATEERYLKKKPGSWRLACQTIVGNKENSGKVVVQRLPQWKK